MPLIVLSMALLTVLPLPVAAELTLQKQVDAPTPPRGSTVEFMVTVSNSGPASASALEVEDRLPPGLLPAAGKGVFTDRGYYDPDSGIWSVGELLPFENATLLLPAVPEQYEAPACYVNQATIRGTNIADSAAVFVGGITGCAVLTLSVTATAPTTSMVFAVAVENAGTETAEDVELQLSATNSAGETDGYTAQAGDIDPGVTYERELYLSFGCNIPADTADYMITAHSPTTSSNNSILTATGSVRYPASDTCTFELNTPYNQSCFVATAVYGTALHPHVRSLRKFRDNVLLELPGGPAVVNLYYRYSAPMADAIAENEGYRWFARVLLAPLIYAIVYPATTPILLGLVLCWWVQRRRQHQPPTP